MLFNTVEHGITALAICHLGFDQKALENTDLLFVAGLFICLFFDVWEIESVFLKNLGWG